MDANLPKIGYKISEIWSFKVDTMKLSFERWLNLARANCDNFSLFIFIPSPDLNLLIKYPHFA